MSDIFQRVSETLEASEEAMTALMDEVTRLRKHIETLERERDELTQAAESVVFKVRSDSVCWHTQMSEDAKMAVAELSRHPTLMKRSNT